MANKPNVMEGNALPVGQWTGSVRRTDLDDGRFVEVGFGESNIYPQAWYIRTGQADSHIVFGLSEAAMDALVCMVFEFDAERDFPS